MLREYLEQEFPNNTVNTRKHAMRPVSRTAKRMFAHYRIPDFTDGIKPGGTKPRATPSVSLRAVADFCDFARDYSNGVGRPFARIEAGIALQGLAGLRLTEAMRLTWDKVDFDLRLIEISGEVKTDSSARLIPICARVEEALYRTQIEQEQAGRGNAKHVLLELNAHPFQHYLIHTNMVHKTRQEWNPAQLLQRFHRLARHVPGRAS